MRRFLAVLAVLSLLVIPVDAAETTKYVALTFDDGPSGRYTRRLLDGLWEREVKATFLLCGYRIKDYPDITQRIFDEGHEIGYHGAFTGASLICTGHWRSWDCWGVLMSQGDSSR